MMSLANTEDNLSSSLLKVASLEISLSAAGEKFLFMQKLREFVSVICEFLQVWIICFMSFLVNSRLVNFLNIYGSALLLLH